MCSTIRAHLRPIGTFGISIEQAHIDGEMFAVIGGQVPPRWGLIGNRESSGGLGMIMSELVFCARAIDSSRKQSV